jgi:competence protein ComEC
MKREVLIEPALRSSDSIARFEINAPSGALIITFSFRRMIARVPRMSANRILNTVLAGFLAGVVLASFFVFAPHIRWVLLLCGILLLIVRHPIALVMGIVLISSGLGVWRTEERISQPSQLWERAAQHPRVVLEGYVDGDFKRTANGGRYTFRVLRVDATEVNERIMVYGPEWVRPRYGQELILMGSLRQPINSDEFDYVSWLAKNDISVQLSYPEYGVPAELTMPWQQRVARDIGAMARALRYAARDAVITAVPQPAAGYIVGILVGDEADIDPSLQKSFSLTGTSHILAISGYNITIVAGALMAALVPFGRRRAYGFAVAGVSIFTVLVGAAPSVIRAAIMGILALTARQLGRQQSVGTAVLFSAALMCLFNPLVLRWDAGFQLSFMAVLGIVYLEPLVRPAGERLVRWKPMADAASTTFAAQVMVFPLILFQFGTLSPYALPVNLLVLPLVPVAMALGGITAALGILWPFLGALVGQLAWLVAAVQIAIIRLASSMPYASSKVAFSATVMMAAYVGLAAWIFSVYRRQSVPPESTENAYVGTNTRPFET